MRNVLIKSLKELSQDKKTFINIFILFLLCFGIGGAIATMGINIQKDTIIQNQDVNSFKDIFLNNIKVSLLIFFTGFFTIGLVPMIIMFLNGLNFTAAFIFFSLTESFVFSIKHSIFHAPIELLGFYFAFVPSLYLYTMFFKNLKKRQKNIISKIINCLLICILANTICLLIAALIEFEVIKLLK